MKNATYACHLCSLHRDELNVPNAVSCDDCIRLSALIPYYHQTVSDEDFIEVCVLRKISCWLKSPILHYCPSGIIAPQKFES